MKIKKVSVGGTQYNLKDTTKIENGKCVNDFATNCIVEIPQDIKLELNGNTVTLKSGSVVTRPSGSQYQTTEDYSTTFNNNGSYYIMWRTGATTLLNWFPVNTVGSGSTLPEDGSVYGVFFNTTDLRYYLWSSGTSQWNAWYPGSTVLPLGIITVSSGVASIDKVFNGAGYVGHHAFVLPDVKGLIPNGFNADGSLASISRKNNALRIFELEVYKNNLALTNFSAVFGTRRIGDDVNDVSEITDTKFHFVKNLNLYYYYYNNALYQDPMTPFITYNYNGTFVKQFDIVQPKGLSSSELFEAIKGAVGYDPTTTQTLKTVNGVLTWVTD